MDREFYGAAEAEEENAGFGYGELSPEANNAVPTPKGYRDRPGMVALSMGFDAAKREIHDIAVKDMTAQEFCDLVLSLAYSFEKVLREDRK